MSTLAKEKVYWVRHPEHGLAIVRATDETGATVAAAKFYGVPWGPIAWQCEIERVMPLFNNICSKCGSMFQGGHTEGTSLCDACAQKIKDENIEMQRRDRRRKQIEQWRKQKKKK